jgi:hypothetical protein
MNPFAKSIRDWFAAIAAGWNNFWFTPSLPHTLALVRICGGAMLLYTHAVWTLRLGDFLGPNSWLNAETSALLNRSPQGVNFAWSYLYYIESPGLLWGLHFAGLVVFAMLTVGWYTRVVAVLAWIISVSYVNRLMGTLFGLDQINVFIATYLMVGDSGGVWSVDRWLAGRCEHWRNAGRSGPCYAAQNTATRLLVCGLFAAGHEEFGDETGPAGLMGGTEACAGVAVKILMKQQVVAEVRIVLELF